ncbi:MAG: metallophosphoesterase [Hyphomonadaceae bacterium]
MKIVVISDTHDRHEDFALLEGGVPEGDVLIHCGDMFQLYDPSGAQVRAIDDWFGRQKFERIFCTGGNHDLALEAAVRSGRPPFRNAEYLQDRLVEHGGRTFYGAPWTPKLRTHAFYLSDDDMARRWALIPQEVDVLITHPPPQGVLDLSSRGRSHGCAELTGAIATRRIGVHCFGHVHASHGRQDRPEAETGARISLNASSVSSALEVVHKPWVIEI